MRIRSPGLTKSGTCTVAPVSSFAGLVVPVAVSPLKPGSVSTDFELDVRGQVDADRRAVVELHVDLHAVFEKVGGVADQVALQREVLERLVVHEVVAFGVVVEHLHFAVVDRRALELLAGAERPFDRRAGLDVLEPGAHEGRPLTGLDVQELDNGPELAVDHRWSRRCENRSKIS